MYRELSPETGKFFDFMVENELMDLVAKPKNVEVTVQVLINIKNLLFSQTSTGQREI